jgi:hypothetical protein
MKDLEKRYFCEDYDKNTICKSNYGPSAECDTLHAGHLYRTFHFGGARTVFSESTPLNQIMATVKDIPVLHFYCCATDSYCDNRHERCSWVPRLRREVDDTLRDVKGVVFSNFPSRTWGSPGP